MKQMKYSETHKSFWFLKKLVLIRALSFFFIYF